MERLLNISRKSTTPFPLVSEEGVQAANDHRCQLELLRVGVGMLNQVEHSPLEVILQNVLASSPSSMNPIMWSTRPSKLTV